MNLRKNLAAKLGAAVASAAALLGTWALVHTNPLPPPTAADTPAATGETSPAATARGERAAAPAGVAVKRHTRTHVS